MIVCMNNYSLNYKGKNHHWQFYYHHDVLPTNWRRFGKSAKNRDVKKNVTTSKHGTEIGK